MRIIRISILLYFLLLLVGCMDEEQTNMSQTINEDFRGEVIELNEDSFLMEYGENDFALLIADTSILEKLTIGDIVIVEIDGGINESDPLQAAAKKVEIVDSAN